MTEHLDSTRAERAYSHVAKRAQDPEKWKQYRTIALKLPVMVHNEGVLAALHFVAARGKKEQRLILDDLARDLKYASPSEMLRALRGKDAAELRAQQREIARILGWYKRMVQAFGKDPQDPSAARGEN